MISVLVCVPTVPGRQAYLVNCARGYERELTPLALGTVGLGPTRTALLHEVEINFSVVNDATSAGEGWQRCVEQGLEWFPQTTHVHFSNDDIVVGPDWLQPLVEACDTGFVPAVRVEPAGGHIEEVIFQTHPPLPPRDHPVRRDPAGYFFAGLPEEQPTESFTPIDHSNLPFCTVDQWSKIGPFVPIHYGSDRWFAERARAAGYQTVAMPGSVVFNYNANIGRHRPPWTEIDYADFDGIFALPAYLAGELELNEPHPLRETEEGLLWVRTWRAGHLGQGTSVMGSRYITHSGDVMTDESRLKLLRRVKEDR